MTWCVLVFLCMWGFEPGTFRKSDFGKEGVGDPPGSLPAGLTDDKPPEWSSRVTFFVGLKNSCRMKKVEQTGPSLSSAGPRAALASKCQ